MQASTQSAIPEDARAQDRSSDVASALLAWYDRNARQLPWRSPPGTPPPDPYRVWLSEVMLQQTTVATVRDYFTRFVERWPDLASFAAAPEAEVLAAWAGLGYYSRARNLVAAARAVVARGGWPQDEAGLRRLPGLGAYTAAAVAAIAFGQRAVVVDANVERVVARLALIDTPLPEARPAIRAAADALTPQARAGDFAQAMMDLGALVCTPRTPRCLICPLVKFCAGAEAGVAATLPVKPAKPPRPLRQGRAFWIERGLGPARAVLLVTRPARGLLGGMRALPDDGWSARRDGHAAPPCPGQWQPAGVVRHGFTHFELDLHLVTTVLTAGAVGPEASGALPGAQWWPVAELTSAGLPTVFARAAALKLG